MNDFLDNFYGILFSPVITFDKLKENQPLFQSFLIILFVSILGSVLNFKPTTEGIIWLGLGIIIKAFIGIISWLFLAFFLDIIASVFKNSGKIKAFLTLSAFALIPWMFLGPVELFKTGGILGHFLSILLGLAIWLWVIVLTVIAINKAYDLSFGRTLVLLLIPFLGGCLALYWTLGFFTTLSQLLNI